MKKLDILLTLCFILFSANFMHSQDVTFNSQTDLDNFDPTTTIITGGLTIDSDNSQNPITDLSNLSNLTTIEKWLVIENNDSLQYLTGFLNLTSVDGTLRIRNNSKLQDLAGFPNLTSIGGTLAITSNSSLQYLNGLFNLSSVGPFLNIKNNLSLQDLNGLSNVGYLGTLEIQNNPNLQYINGFSNLSYVQELLILNNDNLENLDGLSNMTTSGSLLTIENNLSLENLDGLSNMTSWVGYLTILNNDNLQNLDGLSNIDFVFSDLRIQYNSNLSDCCGVRHLLDDPNGVGDYTIINNNPFPCNSSSNVSIVTCIDTVLYVDNSAQGNNSGESWSHAFTDLQDALAIGTGKTIHIAEGTYFPSMQGQRGVSFDIPDGTILRGGYSSGGGYLNTALYETILSGNVDNDASILGDSYHVVTINGATDVEINGITIRDGNANNLNSYARSRGGGVYINNATVEFKDVDFKWNHSIYGGALFAKFSDVIIRTSSFKKNRADYGSALYYSNASNIDLLRSEVVENTSNNRCAIESNNASSTIIKNSLIANNASANANALGLIATNRDATLQILNSTILGETKNKNLITYQVGNNDQADVTINNSIIAHQNPNFDKNMIAYNNNILNLNHNNCYFSGSSTIGNGTNSLYADTVGDLLLNTDYTLDECSPAIDAGDDALGTGAQDYFGNPRYFNTIDIGAYEAQVSCPIPRKSMPQDSKEAYSFIVFPNPSRGKIHIKTSIENPSIAIVDMLGRTLITTQETEVDISHLPKGIYWIQLFENEEKKGTNKLIIQ